MYRLLIAVDTDQERSEQIVSAVADLPVNHEEIEVVLLNVFEEMQTVSDEGSVHSSQLYDESDFPESLEAAAETLAAAGIDVTKRREHGDPAETIIAVAKEVDADCVALCGRKRSPTGKAIFGSVAQSVMLSADWPVLVTMA